MNTAVERFDAKWIPEPNTGCHLWTAALSDNGYGRFGASSKYAHRVAWEREHGPIPAGQQVRHLVCAQRCCVNPRHMRLGDHQANADDRERDGRTHNGETASNARLSAFQVAQVRASYAAGGVTMQQIANTYGIALATAHAIIVRKTWKRTL